MRVEYETSDPETRRTNVATAACVAWIVAAVMTTWIVFANRPTSLKIGRATYSRR